MTDKKRIEILEKAKVLFKDENALYLCHALADSAGIARFKDEQIHQLFPELIKCKTEKPFTEIVWWNTLNTSPRLKVLN